jgi:hypothetical protein
LKEGADRWLDSDIKADIRKMANWLKKRRILILTSFWWGVSIALVIMGYYILVYVEHPEVTQGIVVVYTIVEKWAPRIQLLGYVIIIGASLIAGAQLADFGNVLYGWITSFFLSMLISVFGSFAFVWFVLGVGQSPVITAFGGLGVEVVLQLVFMNVFRMIFPFMPIGCLLTGFVGAVIRALIKPTAVA